MNELIPVDYSNNNIVKDIKDIINQARSQVAGSVNRLMISSYWQIGKRIVVEEQKGAQRAEYGKFIIKELADVLTKEYGAGFSERYLRSFRKFYTLFPDLEIWKSRFPNLTWTHIFRAIRLADPVATRWYLETASLESWSVRTLDRNIASQYYERHYATPMLPSGGNEPTEPEQILKNPIVTEFLGITQNYSFTESELETAIINHLREFIMEMGRGFAFVARQQHIRTEETL